jgi:hypothetical protein
MLPTVQLNTGTHFPLAVKCMQHTKPAGRAGKGVLSKVAHQTLT